MAFLALPLPLLLAHGLLYTLLGIVAMFAPSLLASRFIDPVRGGGGSGGDGGGGGGEERMELAYRHVVQLLAVANVTQGLLHIGSVFMLDIGEIHQWLVRADFLFHVLLLGLEGRRVMSGGALSRQNLSSPVIHLVFVLGFGYSLR
eukprot:TRINITY_DN1516_c0_g1_i3.p1 TRINITY_DN1516_c0_g1~~TRINITY_DN1516_c0_g1_i3.p1  ORF type:complete len:159 (+),score=43.14 TRINITY_DN1516_c0_g1_i3:42-479(+)